MQIILRVIHPHNVMMNFRKLLLEASKAREPITSSHVAARCGRPVREISNGLSRLHRMGLLLRRPEKRLCLSKGRKLCYKGRSYGYYFSKQGRSYLRWMNGPRLLEDVEDLELMEQVVDQLSPDAKDKVLAKLALRGLSRYRGPSRHSRLFDNGFFPVALLLSENSRLRKENWEIAIEYFRLAEENRKFQLEASLAIVWLIISYFELKWKMERLQMRMLEGWSAHLRQDTDGMEYELKIYRLALEVIAMLVAS